MSSMRSLINAGIDTALVRFISTAPVPAISLAERYMNLDGPRDDSDTVMAILTNEAESVGLVLACILRGHRLVSLPLPARGGDLQEYVRFLSRARERHGGACIRARSDIAELLVAAGLPGDAHERALPDPLSATGFELVQFTSGTTGPPTTVVLSDAALGYNVENILRTLDPRSGEVTVSWLPLSHDMGLIGMLLSAIAGCSAQFAGKATITLLTPESFLRSAETWPDAMGELHATITAAPSFGFARASRRAARSDLSALRVAIVGGEIVSHRALESFASAHGSTGFDPVAFCPAYGLAEIGLCATLTPPGELYRARTVDLDGRDAISLVSSGPAIAGHQVRAAPSSPLAGRIEVITAAQLENASTDSQSGHSKVTTGDVGFVDEGWLYVVGRDDDFAVQNGRKVYLPHVESAIGEVSGIRSGRVAVFDEPTGGLVVVAEVDAPINSRQQVRLETTVRAAVVASTGLRAETLSFVDKNEVAVTTSGKLRRNACRQAYLSGQLRPATGEG